MLKTNLEDIHLTKSCSMGMRSSGFAVGKERSSLGEGGRGTILPAREEFNG